jgi:DNA-binding transcriptional LysR family regulator
MDIHQLRLFASVFRNKSFSKASCEMKLTQPTVSDHIKSLEAELGCKLFDRLGRSIVPTKEAETLYSHSIEIIEKTDSVKEILRQFKKEHSGELIIGASTIPGSYLLPFLMASFSGKYPRISLQISIGDSREIVARLLSHDLLLGIVGTSLPDEKLLYTHLTDDELVAVSSPSFMKGKSVNIQELLKMPFVLREKGSGTRLEMERIIERAGHDACNLNTTAIFGSTEAVKQAVMAGMGVSILSRISVQDAIKRHSLKEVKLTDIDMKRSIYAVTHKKRSLPPVYSLFIEHVANEIRKSMPHHS